MSEETGQKPINPWVISIPGFKDYVKMSFPIGSRYVCEPPVMDTDKDTLILVTDLACAVAILLEDGWTLCNNSEYIDGVFIALRKGIDNYVLTKDSTFFERYVFAAQVAKALNLTDKEDRIKVHNALINASGGCFGLVQWEAGQNWSTA